MISKCLNCDAEIEIYKTGHKRMRKFCNKSCSASYNNKVHPKRISRFNEDVLKKDVSRQEIGAHARNVYKKSNKPHHCILCGYSIHHDVCHIKQVYEFDDKTKLGEINHIDNLVALCKNHHWEFDNGYLDINLILQSQSAAMFYETD